MAYQSKKQSVIKGLQALGYVQTFGRITRKYQVFNAPDQSHQILIGRSGGIRKVGWNERLTKSISLTDTVAHRILETIGSEAPFILSEGEDLRRWAEAEWAHQARKYLRPAAPLPPSTWECPTCGRADCGGCVASSQNLSCFL